MAATGHRGDAYSSTCPCRGMLDMLADKWSALIIGALNNGPMRFGELRTRLDGISPKVLTASLRRLENAGMLTRTVYPTAPVRVDYSLTELGSDAAGPLDALRVWVEDNLDRFPAVS